MKLKSHQLGKRNLRTRTLANWMALLDFWLADKHEWQHWVIFHQANALAFTHSACQVVDYARLISLRKWSKCNVFTCCILAKFTDLRRGAYVLKLIWHISGSSNGSVFLWRQWECRWRCETSREQRDRKRERECVCLCFCERSTGIFFGTKHLVWISFVEPSVESLHSVSSWFNNIDWCFVQWMKVCFEPNRTSYIYCVWLCYIWISVSSTYMLNLCVWAC